MTTWTMMMLLSIPMLGAISGSWAVYLAIQARRMSRRSGTELLNDMTEEELT